MVKSKQFGLDTSVVLRLIVGEPRSLAERALQFLTQARENGDSLLVSNLVVCETYFALHSHYGVPKRRALGTLINMLTEGPVSAVADSCILEVLKASFAGAQKPGFADRLIHAEYRSGDAETVSFEKAARKLPGTHVL